MKPTSTKHSPHPAAVLWQGWASSASGALIHCGPFWARGRMSKRTLIKRERRWQAWRAAAYGQRVPGFASRRLFATREDAS